MPKASQVIDHPHKKHVLLKLPKSPPIRLASPSKNLSARRSPTWQCEDGSLPMASDEAPQELGNLVQSHNAKSPHWDPWQDRHLIDIVYKLQPFDAPPNTVIDAWDQTAQQLREVTTAEGPRSITIRSGSACHNRFNELVKKHRQAETRSLQATGKDEEINLFIKMMTDIVALLDDQAAARAVKSGQKQTKEIVENTASSQIRIASMKGLVRGESMVDVSSLPGASVREKQAQRGVKRRAVSLSNGDKENHAPGVLPRKRRHSEYQRLLMEQIEHEKQELDDLRARDEQRHNEMVALQQQTIETLSNVTSLLEAQQQHEIERRNEQVARNLQEKEQQAALTAAILTLSLNLSKSK